jgi:hypothetical protein
MIRTARGQSKRGGRFPPSARPIRIVEGAKQPVYSAGPIKHLSSKFARDVPPRDTGAAPPRAKAGAARLTGFQYRPVTPHTPDRRPSRIITYSIAARTPAIVVGGVQHSASRASSAAARCSGCRMKAWAAIEPHLPRNQPVPVIPAGAAASAPSATIRNVIAAACASSRTP